MSHPSGADTALAIDCVNRYCHALDYGAVGDFVACFTANGVIELIYADRDPSVYRGPEELAAFYHQVRSLPGSYRHLALSPVVGLAERAEDLTTSSYNVVVASSGDASPYVHAYSRYEDIVRRGDDGSYQIAHRKVHIEATTAALM